MLMKHSTQLYNMKYIEKPNLPQNRVGVVAISSLANESIESLNGLGIKALKIKPDLRLPFPVNSHADLQILHVRNETFFIQSEHLCVGESDIKFNTIKISDLPGNKYPNDVRLNCAIIGNKIICNKKTIAKEILEFAEKSNFKVINVNQGYTKCSVCVVNENAIITDDKSIFSAVGNFFDDVQLISKKSIRLDGYNYGFIGGCCGKIDKNKIAFNGAIESHTDYKSIIDFLNRNNVKCVELHQNRLTDIGGIIPLVEF